MTFKKLLLASAISSVFVVGCGDDDNDSNPGTGGTPPPSTNDCTIEDNTLKGTIECDLTLEAGEYFLIGEVNVGKGSLKLDSAAEVQSAKDNGVTLTLKPGVHIKADQDGVLLVNRGSKLDAVGTPEQPITFSSQTDIDFDGQGEWGGVVIQGFAPHNAAGTNTLCSANGAICNVKGEGGDAVGFFGGTDEADSSGRMKYVRIAEGGKVAGPGNEINGLTLQGVGYGTELSHIQVHGNLDDGIEWFGGRANVKYVVLTNNDDDDLDFDEGYQGHIQHALIIKNQTKAAPTGSNDPRGVEANSSDDESAKSTKAKLANITVIGSDMVKDIPAVDGACDDDIDTNDTGCNEQPGMRLRGDVTVDVINSVVANYGICLRLDNGQDDMTTVAYENVLIGGCDSATKYKANGIEGSGSVAPTPSGEPVEVDAIMFDSAMAATDDNAMLDSNVSISPLSGRTDFTFDNTDYEGAVNPDSSVSDRNWWEGWTLPGTVAVAGDLQAQ